MASIGTLLTPQQLLGGAICLVGSTLAIVGMNMQRWSLLQLAFMVRPSGARGGALEL